MNDVTSSLTMPEKHNAIREIENVFIPLPDGVRLAARIWLPEDAEDNPVPAILEYIPYRKRDFTRARDETMHPYFAAHGYAGVRVDLRGSGDSEGVLTDEYLPQELDDGIAVIEWLAEQPWCDGNVGMIGISWGGFNGLQIAARQPPALKAVVSASSSDDRYADDVHYMGGCLLGDNLSWASVMFAFNSLPPDPQIVGEAWREMWMQRLEGSGLWLETWLEHQQRDDYWRHGSVCENFNKIQCPVMAVSGWADGYTNSVFRLLENLEVPCQGLVGPWSHKYPHQGVPGPAIDFQGELLRWWDRWLKGVDNGIDDEPMLRAWVQESVQPSARYRYRPGRWVGEPEWPSPNVTNRELQFEPGRLSDSGGPGEPTELTVQSPLSVGFFAGKWCSYAAGPDQPYDQREDDGGSLVFDSAPLTEELELLGAPVVDLTLSCNRTTGMVAVRLSDVAEDGKSTRLTYGLLNLNHHAGHDQAELLEPGRQYSVQVQLNNLGQRIPAGHSLRISISTSYWPLAWPPAAPTRLSVYTEGCRLRLPVRQPRAEDERIHFGPPPVAETGDMERIHKGEQRWVVHRDLDTNVSTLEVIKDEGRYRIEDIDLEITDDTREWYSYQLDDFCSPTGEVLSIRQLRRDDWRIYTRTRSVLTANPQHYDLYAELDAYVNSRRVYSRNWSRQIPRKFT